jgi:hypothetical protein
VKLLHEREAAGEAPTPTFVMLRAEWEKRLLEARIAIAPTQTARIALLEEYLKLVKSRDFIPGRETSGKRLYLSMTAYEIADAELRLAELKQSK